MPHIFLLQRYRSMSQYSFLLLLRSNRVVAFSSIASSRHSKPNTVDHHCNYDAPPCYASSSPCPSSPFNITRRNTKTSAAPWLHASGGGEYPISCILPSISLRPAQISLKTEDLPENPKTKPNNPQAQSCLKSVLMKRTQRRIKRTCTSSSKDQLQKTRGEIPAR